MLVSLDVCIRYKNCSVSLFIPRSMLWQSPQVSCWVSRWLHFSHCGFLSRYGHSVYLTSAYIWQTQRAQSQIKCLVVFQEVLAVVSWWNYFLSKGSEAQYLFTEEIALQSLLAILLSVWTVRCSHPRLWQCLILAPVKDAPSHLYPRSGLLDGSCKALNNHHFIDYIGSAEDVTPFHLQEDSPSLLKCSVHWNFVWPLVLIPEVSNIFPIVYIWGGLTSNLLQQHSSQG